MTLTAAFTHSFVLRLYSDPLTPPGGSLEVGRLAEPVEPDPEPPSVQPAGRGGNVGTELWTFSPTILVLLAVARASWAPVMLLLTVKVAVKGSGFNIWRVIVVLFVHASKLQWPVRTNMHQPLFFFFFIIRNMKQTVLDSLEIQDYFIFVLFFVCLFFQNNDVLFNTSSLAPEMFEAISKENSECLVIKKQLI